MGNSISKSDLILHAEGNYLVGTQKHSQVLDAINGLFGAVEDLGKHGVIVSVTMGQGDYEAEEFPKMFYKDGENPIVVGSEQEANELGEGWADSPQGEQPVAREPQFPHQQPTKVPSDPGLIPNAKNPIGGEDGGSVELPEDSPILAEGPTDEVGKGGPASQSAEGPKAEPVSSVEPLPQGQTQHPAGSFGPAATQAQVPLEARGVVPIGPEAEVSDEQPAGAPSVNKGSGGAPGSGLSS